MSASAMQGGHNETLEVTEPHLNGALCTISSSSVIDVGFFAGANAAVNFSKQSPVNHLEEHSTSPRIHCLLCGSTVRLVF